MALSRVMLAAMAAVASAYVQTPLLQSRSKVALSKVTPSMSLIESTTAVEQISNTLAGTSPRSASLRNPRGVRGAGSAGERLCFDAPRSACPSSDKA